MWICIYIYIYIFVSNVSKHGLRGIPSYMPILCGISQPYWTAQGKFRITSGYELSPILKQDLSQYH